MNVNNVAKSEQLVQFLTSSVSDNPSLTVPTEHLMKTYWYITVTDEFKHYDESLARSN